MHQEYIAKSFPLLALKSLHNLNLNLILASVAVIMEKFIQAVATKGFPIPGN